MPASPGRCCAADCSDAAARAAQPGWAALSGHARARFLYAIARTVQKRERFLAVLETLDNGKPIRESRDIDVPLVARHFLHHAGWAAVLEDLAKQGFARAIVDGELVELTATSELELERYEMHTIQVVVDRLVAELSTEENR